MEIQEKSKTSRERIKKVNTSQSTKQEETKGVKEVKYPEEVKEPKNLEVPKIMTAIAALTIRELVNIANKYGIKREDVITIVKDNGQYVLIHYSPSI